MCEEMAFATRCARKTPLFTYMALGKFVHAPRWQGTRNESVTPALLRGTGLLNQKDRTMGRLWIAPTKNGKVRILLGQAAVREKRRIGRKIDEIIGKAMSGKLEDADAGEVAVLASLADRLARGGAV
jgi:hypothetical protein